MSLKVIIIIIVVLTIAVYVVVVAIFIDIPLFSKRSDRHCNIDLVSASPDRSGWWYTAEAHCLV